MRIALVPLDDRPCNRVFPQRLADIAGVDLQLPPGDLLGHFLQPGDPAGLLHWVEDVSPEVDALILSVDMMTYGGLVASRSPEAAVKPPGEWISAIDRIRDRWPDLAVYGFSVITRLGITGSDVESRHWHPLIHRYCELLEPAGAGDAGATAESERLAGQIPPDLLAGVMAVRHRNHETNLAAVQAAAGSILDALVLAQEDAAPRGAHRLEQEALMEQIILQGVMGRAWIYPGADEVGLLLMARALRDYQETIPSELMFHFVPPVSAGAIPPYEDRPLNESLQTQIQACGMELGRGFNSGNPDERSARLLIYGPGGDASTDQDSHFPERARSEAGGMIAVIRDRVDAAIANGRHAALADVFAPNGADMRLIAALGGSQPVFARLSAYAGWNTAGNCIGTVLAHLTCLQAAAPDARDLRPLAHYRFLFERLVDDWAYQAVVRPALNVELEQQSFLPANLGRFAPDVETRIRTLLPPLATRLFEQHFKGIRCVEGVLTHLERFDVSLCWPRTFEVEIESILGVGGEAESGHH